MINSKNFQKPNTQGAIENESLILHYRHFYIDFGFNPLRMCVSGFPWHPIWLWFRMFSTSVAAGFDLRRRERFWWRSRGPSEANSHARGQRTPNVALPGAKGNLLPCLPLIHVYTLSRGAWGSIVFPGAAPVRNSFRYHHSKPSPTNQTKLLFSWTCT